MKRSGKLYIYGSGGHGKVVLDILLESRVAVAGFIDDDLARRGRRISGLEVVGNIECLAGKIGISIVLGIGNNVIREKTFKKVMSLGFEVINALHPRAILSKNIKLGKGVVIMPGAIINAGTVIEDGVVVNTGASVDHDCHLGRFCQIWPGAHLAGSVSVGVLSYVGTGAAVIQNLTIGKNAIIGAGAAVITDIPDGATAVGVPARLITRSESGA